VMAERVGTLEEVLTGYGMSSADLTPATSLDDVRLTGKILPLRVPVSQEQVDAFSPRLVPVATKFDPELEVRRRKLRGAWGVHPMNFVAESLRVILGF
jgi:hypothetical protein